MEVEEGLKLELEKVKEQVRVKTSSIEDTERKHLVQMSRKLYKAKQRHGDFVEKTYTTYREAYKQHELHKDDKYTDYCLMMEWEKDHLYDLGKLAQYEAYE
jgi:hypothetical protein